MTISKQAAQYLEQLCATGLYGATVEDVMERLITERLRQLIKDGAISARASQEAPGPRCPTCGSPRLNLMEAMGHSEYQCLDCNHRFAP